MSAPIGIVHKTLGYIPRWDGEEIPKAPAALLSTLRAIEVREYVPAMSEFDYPHFRIWAEGPEGIFGWDIVPRPGRGAVCVFAVRDPEWDEFFDPLRVGPTIFISDGELDRISSSFPAVVGIPGGVRVCPLPAGTWAVDDGVVVVHLTQLSSAWQRDEVIGIKPGLYRAQRIKGRVLFQ